MKGKILLILSLFLICGCNKNVNSNQMTSQSIPNESSSVSNANVNSTNSNSSERTIEYDTNYLATSWSKHLVDTIGIVAGDYKSQIPLLEAERYSYFLTVDTVTSLDVVIIHCYDTDESVIDEYEIDLVKNGFSLSSENPYAWMEVSITEDLVVQYESVYDQDGNECIELMIYKVELRLASWPQDVIETITTEVIPVVDGRSYEAYADFTIDYKARIIVYVNNPSITNVKEYESLLVSEGYTINSTFMYDEGVSSLGTHVMYSYDEYEDIFAIYIYNDWPYFDLTYYLGMDLPRLDDVNAIMSYKYLVTDDYENLVIYYDNVDKSALTTYGEQLKKIGFITEGDEITTYPSEINEFTITSQTFVINSHEENEHFVTLMYCLEQQSLAIII